MKKTIYLFSTLFFFTFITCGQQNETSNRQDKEQWKKYADSKCEIQYPVDWEERTTGEMGARFILLSTKDSENDQFRENVNFLIQDFQGQNMDLDSYVSISENQVRTLITNGELLVSERQNNDNVEHHKLIYYGQQGMFDLRFEQYFWVINENAYILTFTCEKEKYKHYKDVSQQILSSFKMK